MGGIECVFEILAIESGQRNSLPIQEVERKVDVESSLCQRMAFFQKETSTLADLSADHLLGILTPCHLGAQGSVVANSWPRGETRLGCSKCGARSFFCCQRNG